MRWGINNLHYRFENSCSKALHLNYNNLQTTYPYQHDTSYILLPASHRIVGEKWVLNAICEGISLYHTSCCACVEDRENGGRSRVQPIVLTCSINSSCDSQIQFVSWKSSSSSRSLLISLLSRPYSSSFCTPGNFTRHQTSFPTWMRSKTCSGVWPSNISKELPPFFDFNS